MIALPEKPIFITGSPFVVSKAMALKKTQVKILATPDQLSRGEKTICEILAGKHTRKCIVEETEDGYKIYSSELMGQLEQFCDHELSVWIEARLNLIKILSDLGYDVVAFSCGESTNSNSEDQFAKLAFDHGAMGVIKTNGKLSCFERFPRDMFFQLKGMLCFNKRWGYSEFPLHLGFKGRLSPGWFIGGGNFFAHDNFALISGLKEQTKDTTIKAVEQQRNFIKQSFKKVYELPYCWIDIVPPSFMKEYFDTEKRLLVPHLHADFAVCLLKAKNVLLARPAYYRGNKALLDMIADKEKLDLKVLADDSWYAINILELPDGSVLIDKSEQETIKLVSSITTVHQTPQAYGGVGLRGGLRCAINILWV